MRYLALACSYDETIAVEGEIDGETELGLRRLVASGRQLILLSRRPVARIAQRLPADLFAVVVAEHGGLLYWPATGRSRRLADPLPRSLAEHPALRDAEPRTVGEVVFTVGGDHEVALRTALEDVRAEVEVIADKDLLVAAPPAVTKAAGLRAALAALELSPHNVLGIGDADSDAGFLECCELAVAVANAPDGVKRRCDLVTAAPRGAGVVELVDQLRTDDLAALTARVQRRGLVLGRAEGADVRIPTLGSSLVLAGPAGTGKSTLLAGLLARLVHAGYQFCVLDREGDHEDLAGAAHVGQRRRRPSPEDVARLLRDPERSVVANLLGVPLASLPTFLRRLLPELQSLRTAAGRPNVLVLDEAHLFLPLPGDPEAVPVPRELDGLIMATVNPEHIAPTALSLADHIVTFGDATRSALERLCHTIGERAPEHDVDEAGGGEALLWRRGHDGRVERFAIAGGQTERRPHWRRYAEKRARPGQERLRGRRARPDRRDH